MSSPTPATVSSPEDAPFHHYTFKHRITAWISQRIFGNLVYTCQHGLTKGMRRKGGLGWVPQWLSGSTETREQQFWRSLDFTSQVVYDVGAFHGLLGMYFARTASRVICFEPNNKNRQRLQENLALNQVRNITIRPFGIGSEPGKAVMYFMDLMSGGASIDQMTVENLKDKSVQEQSIEITTIDAEIAAGMPVPDFIKIDVEGYELAALRGARETLAKHSPTLFLEMHGETIREKKIKVRGITEFLAALGYSITHVESGLIITPDNCVEAMEGHLHASKTAAPR